MDDLIEQNMGLVLTVVNKFNPKNQTEKDAYVQAGRIGLWKALCKFSTSGGSKFSPYAWNPIRWEIIKEIRAINGKNLNNLSPIEAHQDQPDLDNTNTFWEWMPTTLTAAEENVITLKLEGHTFKDISTKLNLQRANVKKIFDSAVNKIRETNKYD